MCTEIRTIFLGVRNPAAQETFGLRGACVVFVCAEKNCLELEQNSLSKAVVWYVEQRDSSITGEKAIATVRSRF